MGTDNGERVSSGSAYEAGSSLEVIPLHSTNLLTVLDEQGVIQYESPAIERIYGYTQSELVGEQVAEYFHPDDRELVVEAFQTVVRSDSETVESVEYRHRQADGTYCWVESVASSDRTPQGDYVVNTRDISEQKAREQRLQDKNERLDEFARTLSHDLRNPLTVASGRIELARENRDSEHLDRAAGAIKRTLTLVDDLLTLARNGDEIRALEPVALGDSAIHSWQHVVTQDATLSTRCDRKIEADPARLQQLLENLFRNSVEHGGDDVTVTVGTMENGFFVEDDGPGIRAADREWVFETGHSTGETQSGFGLPIVEQIVEAHDWEISVRDSEAGGARFEVTGVERTQ